ncbi:hypothetical protein, partial [Staphylococcus pettenkoferi]|uniref:hypothetical protein n=1 Tax=Staphylococcus pettenkoferi TaxID=170573 RepID=UPI001C930FC0
MESESKSEIGRNVWKRKEACEGERDSEDMLNEVGDGLGLVDECEVEQVEVDDVVSYVRESLD